MLNLGIDLPSERRRRLKEVDEISKLNPEDTAIFCNNIIDNYYPNRPKSLENMCLYEFASNYDYKTSKCKDTEYHKNCLPFTKWLGVFT